MVATNVNSCPLFDSMACTVRLFLFKLSTPIPIDVYQSVYLWYYYYCALVVFVIVYSKLVLIDYPLIARPLSWQRISWTKRKGLFNNRKRSLELRRTGMHSTLNIRIMSVMHSFRKTGERDAILQTTCSIVDL